MKATIVHLPNGKWQLQTEHGHSSVARYHDYIVFPTKEGTYIGCTAYHGAATVKFTPGQEVACEVDEVDNTTDPLPEAIGRLYNGQINLIELENHLVNGGWSSERAAKLVEALAS